MSSLALSASVQRAFERLAADLRRAFGDRFVALVAYGRDASVAFAASVRPDDLDALGPLVAGWHHDGLATPLVITPTEFRRSLDAFPLEYQDILDRHAVIAGTPPFADVRIDAGDLRRACEAQARSHLIHLRQGWLQAAGHQHQMVDLIVRSAGPFRALVANVARLHGERSGTDEQLAVFCEQTIGLSGPLVRALLSLEAHPERGPQAASHIGEYLNTTERLWDFVDAWRGRR